MPPGSTLCQRIMVFASCHREASPSRVLENKPRKYHWLKCKDKRDIDISWLESRQGDGYKILCSCNKCGIKSYQGHKSSSYGPSRGLQWWVILGIGYNCQWESDISWHRGQITLFVLWMATPNTEFPFTLCISNVSSIILHSIELLAHKIAGKGVGCIHENQTLLIPFQFDQCRVFPSTIWDFRAQYS